MLDLVAFNIDHGRPHPGEIKTKTGGPDHAVGQPFSLFGAHLKGANCLLDSRDLHAIANRTGTDRNVAIMSSHDVISGQEGIWFMAVICRAGESILPVRRDKRECVPALTAPGVGGLRRAFLHDMFATGPSQMVA